MLTKIRDFFQKTAKNYHKNSVIFHKIFLFRAFEISLKIMYDALIFDLNNI